MDTILRSRNTLSSIVDEMNKEIEDGFKVGFYIWLDDKYPKDFDNVLNIFETALTVFGTDGDMKKLQPFIDEYRNKIVGWMKQYKGINPELKEKDFMDQIDLFMK